MVLTGPWDTPQKSGDSGPSTVSWAGLDPEMEVTSLRRLKHISHGCSFQNTGSNLMVDYEFLPLYNWKPKEADMLL